MNVFMIKLAQFRLQKYGSMVFGVMPKMMILTIAILIFCCCLIRQRTSRLGIVAELPPRSEVVTDWAAPKFATKQLDLRLTSLAVIVLQKPAELIKSGQPFADATKLLISFILALRSSAKVNNLVNARATFNKRSYSWVQGVPWQCSRTWASSWLSNAKHSSKGAAEHLVNAPHEHGSFLIYIELSRSQLLSKSETFRAG